MNTKRNSNFELLRIIAMFLIIIYHIYCHCISVQLTDGSLITKMNNGWFCEPQFFKQLLILNLISPLGKIGDTIFILISGYFMVNKGKDVDIVKVSKKLLLQQGFAAVVLVISSFLLFKVVQPSFKVTMLEINTFNGMSWFAGYYFLIILIAFLGLNKFLEGTSKENYIKFLMITFTVSQLDWIGAILDRFSKGLLTVVTGVFVYSLGGYIRKYDVFSNIKSYVFGVVIIVANLFVCLSGYNADQNAIGDFGTGMFIQEIPDYADNHIVPILIGISLFELFRRISIDQNRIINFLGGATFMAYLIHDNDFVYSIWRSKDWITLIYNSPARYIVEHVIYALCTFAIGVIIYALYLLVCRLSKNCIRLVIKS